jgi:hypothetical protein
MNDVMLAKSVETREKAKSYRRKTLLQLNTNYADQEKGK